ncbi:helix-turn-helix domain-containing protein [Phenylobacterium sp.]|jgi:putative transcriptional regulator|uniref:helix-turn-helix domain-containing protein n=1 Tax=Phenylobacterium sp. TaxID=1871053 RepID=UPI0028A1066B|nr:helix-turn-helix domain-containing protein [Phenylobacterium sp.]
MTDFGKDLIESLGEAVQYAKGKRAGLRTHAVEVPDVKSLRQSLGLTQQAFADAYHIPLATLKGWEMGRRQPDATAAAYLNVIASIPNEARKALT